MSSIYSTKRRSSSPDLGLRMCLARRVAGLSQQQVASVVGVSRAAASQWEGGTSAPTAAHLAIVAETLAVSIDWLVGGHGVGPLDRIVAALEALSRNELAEIGRRVGVGKVFDQIVAPI